MSEFPPCPQCKSPYTYESGTMLACSECGHEWQVAEVAAEEAVVEEGMIVKDSNGNLLKDGDAVVILKDLPVKGFLRSIKAGTKVKNIRLVEGDHNIDCKVDGFGAMALKSEFVKKA
ncbi:MAG TPA: zinc ribbon domain-containing protein YjdM [Cytophagales bacterium]|nr:zinc ribbon domain-containing protein YjdM [Cytophagales bacterium]